MRVYKPEDTSHLPTGRCEVDWMALRSNSIFTRLLIAGVASQAGQSIASVAILWLVYVRTGSAIDVALVGIFQALAYVIVGLPAGALVDRFARIGLMVSSDLVRAVLVAALGVCLLLIGFDLELALGVTFLVASASTVFQPAEQAFLPVTVAASDLPSANGLIRSTRSIAQFASTSVGGVLVLAFGVSVALFLNSITFLASAALLFGVLVATRHRGKPDSPSVGAKSPGVFRQIADGFAWLRSSASGLLQLAISATFINFFGFVFTPFFVIYAAETLRGNALTYGALLSFLTVGIAVGSLIVPRTGALRHTGKVWALVYGVGGGIATLGFGLTDSVWVAFVCGFLLGGTIGFAGTTWLTTAQLLVPEYMQGRYFALDSVTSWGVVPVGQAVGAVLISDWGLIAAIEVAGFGLVATGLLSVLGRNLWQLRAPDIALRSTGMPGGVGP